MTESFNIDPHKLAQEMKDEQSRHAEKHPGQHHVNPGIFDEEKQRLETLLENAATDEEKDHASRLLRRLSGMQRMNDTSATPASPDPDQ